MSGYRHVVVFRLDDGCGPERLAEALTLLRELGEFPGVVDWRVEESLDSRKGVVLVENGLFADPAAFEAFRSSPRHAAASARMRQFADWWVADYLE